MSLVHLRFIQVFQDPVFVVYDVESIDMNDDLVPEIIGTIKIDKTNNDYMFTCCDKYLNKKIIPPTVFDLDDTEQKLLFETKYKDFGYGAWSRRINTWVKSFISKNEYPSVYP